MLLRGPILNPRFDGTVEFIPDGLIGGEERITHIGPWESLASQFDAKQVEQIQGVICPPFLDNHTHIPQHPIRGHFMDGVEANPPGGRLIAGLDRNVYPAEARCADPQYTWEVVRKFLSDTLARGVIGGAAFMTVDVFATRIALELLPPTWSVGPVLMNMNCPTFLRTDASSLEQEVAEIASVHGRRVILADRFAVCVSSSLRREGVKLSQNLGLRMQTHLNEQLKEKEFVEKTLYPDAANYTDVYSRDGLLGCEPIMAHCIWMSPTEFDLLAKNRASIAHCPTSNTLLGSGIMPLDLVHERELDYAICTDVGASPTTSMLCEMSQFLRVHEGISKHATPQTALYRATLAPAKMLGLHQEIGSFRAGKQMTFIEIDCDTTNISQLSADEMIRSRLLEYSSPNAGLSAALENLRGGGLGISTDLLVLQRDFEQTIARLDKKVRRVVINGQSAYQRNV
ncbi:MAG TPA: amidohydrolase family protein [Tepidisphaeraceae bacterium]|nr:amidohydrolase family protein [Tepidisphaeraceae bacterium]